MLTAPNPLHAAAPGAEPVVYYSGKVFLAMFLTLGQKLGAPEALLSTAGKIRKISSNEDSIFERRKIFEREFIQGFEDSNED